MGKEENTAELAELVRKDAECVMVKQLRAVPGLSSMYHLDPDILHVTYTRSGRGKCIVGETEYALHRGTVNIIYPYEPHAFVPDPDDPYFNCNLKIRFRGRIPYGFPRIIMTGRKNRRYEKIFDDLYKLFREEKTSLNALKQTLLLLQLFILLLELAPEDEDQIFPQCANVGFAEAVSRLQTPPFEFPGIAGFARRCGMCKRSFTGFFKKTTGLTVREFWLRAKMSYARKLLESRGYSIKEVAEQCGFSNSQNFIRSFRKFHRESPGKWKINQN